MLSAAGFAPVTRMCSPHYPFQRSSALPLACSSPFPSSTAPATTPLRRGSVLPLGVEAQHLKIEVTQAYFTSVPSPCTPFGPYIEPRRRSVDLEQASDNMLCVLSHRSSQLGNGCRLGSRRAPARPTTLLCTLAPQRVKTLVVCDCSNSRLALAHPFCKLL